MGYLKTQAEAKELLANFESFTTGTLSANYEHTDLEKNNAVYVVRSYGVIIATTATETPWITGQKYSQTTSRHTNLVRKAWGLN